jgi:hypothetical protein
MCKVLSAGLPTTAGWQPALPRLAQIVFSQSDPDALMHGNGSGENQNAIAQTQTRSAPT